MPVQITTIGGSDIPRNSRNTITATIDGQQANIVYAGLTPGFFVGTYQANLTVPFVDSGMADLVFTVAGISSSPVSIPVLVVLPRRSYITGTATIG